MGLLIPRLLPTGGDDWDTPAGDIAWLTPGEPSPAKQLWYYATQEAATRSSAAAQHAGCATHGALAGETWPFVCCTSWTASVAMLGWGHLRPTCSGRQRRALKADILGAELEIKSGVRSHFSHSTCMLPIFAAFALKKH